jgi:hypothetical protein
LPLLATSSEPPQFHNWADEGVAAPAMPTPRLNANARLLTLLLIISDLREARRFAWQTTRRSTCSVAREYPDITEPTGPP